MSDDTHKARCFYCPARSGKQRAHRIGWVQYESGGWCCPKCAKVIILAVAKGEEKLARYPAVPERRPLDPTIDEGNCHASR